MNKLIAPLSALIIISGVGGVFLLKHQSRISDQTALIVISPTPTPIPQVTAIPALSSSPTPSPSAPALSKNSRVDYVRMQLFSAGIDAATFNNALADKRLVVYPVKTVAYKEPNWKAIEDKMYSPDFVQRGKNYLSMHQAVFDQAEQQFGVSKEALTGLIGIETEFGKNAGTYPIFNVLYSRTLRWPAISWQAQADQFVAFVMYCVQSKIDCYGIKGSYAGAFGIVQFMPNSLLAYGVDGDHDGIINLSQEADAIPSAANFLKKHGWDDDHLKSLARYYGSSIGYPGIVLTYADLLKK